MLKIEKIRCGACGAPLKVPQSVSFVTCNHCSTQLAIHRTDDVSFSEKLDAVAEEQVDLRDRLADLERQNRAAVLDRQWQDQQESFQIQHKGKTSLPSDAAGYGGVAMGIFGGLFVLLLFPGGMKWFGVLFAMVGIGGGLYQLSRASEYRRARKKYQRHRREILSGRRDDERDENLDQTLAAIGTPSESP